MSTTPTPGSWADPNQTPPVETATPEQTDAPAEQAEPVTTTPATQTVHETLVAPGSAGPIVRELAQLLEQLGHETYLTRGDNHSDVMTDDMLRQVKQVVSAHVKETADIDELELKLRDVALLAVVDGELWQLLRNKAAAAAPAEAPAA